MATLLRSLGPQDLPAVRRLLDARPVENLFLAAKLETVGIDRRRLGTLHGFERDGELTAVCLDGGTVFPAGDDPEAIPGFVRAIGPVRSAASILGPSMQALGLHLGLSERWPGAWGSELNVRRVQPLMLLDHLPLGETDPRVRMLTQRDYDSYLHASVDMYTEEIGTSPFKYGPGYERFVRERLRSGDAYGIVDEGRVIFKADLGPRVGDHVQLQGVWLEPELRGRGLSVPALAGMLRRVMRRYERVSLYVNDFNAAAVRAYERLGFERVGTLSTVHY